METSNNGSIVSQPSTCLKMREIVEIINEYKKSRTESSALLINKFLQVFMIIYFTYKFYNVFFRRIVLQ